MNSKVTPRVFEVKGRLDSDEMMKQSPEKMKILTNKKQTRAFPFYALIPWENEKMREKRKYFKGNVVKVLYYMEHNIHGLLSKDKTLNTIKYIPSL